MRCPLDVEARVHVGGLGWRQYVPPRMYSVRLSPDSLAGRKLNSCVPTERNLTWVFGHVILRTLHLSRS